MKTLDALLMAVFVSLVAYAAMTHTPAPILAAAIAAALLIGIADESSPRHYLPGQRRSATVDMDIVFVARQIRLWQSYLLICILAMITTAAYLFFIIKDGRWPGDWVSIPFLGKAQQGIVLGLIVALLMLYCLTISVGCIQPLEKALNRFYSEYNFCMQSERSREATIGNPDWHSCNQLDWDHSPIARAARRRNEEDGTARPPYNGSY